MAVKSVVIPWISGGALLLGYAAFAWLRGKRGAEPAPAEGGLLRREYDVARLSDRLEHVPEQLTLRSEPNPAEDVSAFDAESSELELPPHEHAAARRAGALFLGRASSALSPFQNRNAVPHEPRSTATAKL